MKDNNTPGPSALSRSATLSRFRPISLPVYLDYKVPPTRRPASPAAPQRPALAGTKQVSSGFQIPSIPRILRPAPRTPLLSKVRPPHPTPAPTPTLPTTLSTRTPPPPAAPAPYKSNESRCCQMLIHGLFVAFEDDFASSSPPLPHPRAESLKADGNLPFTHLISLSTRHRAQIKHTIDRTSGVERLKLRLPRLYSPTPPTAAELDAKVALARAAARREGRELSQEDYFDAVFDEGEGSGYTGLEALQLLAARDFLYASGLSAASDTVRVLVTTPRDHRTDAIAVVMGYLSLVLGARVERVLRTQDAHPRVLGIWKGTVSEECAAFIEDVCRL
ncbi:hypothetical protein DFH06DRAFT_1368088 [Mycena polygramma]|nr:hypothetical protein DFH06DRAFT_1368088 [Mycena polygramma]